MRIGILSGILAISVALGSAAAYLHSLPPEIPKASAHVQITSADSSRGSGVHLGGGLFLTARHILTNDAGETATEASVVDENGKIFNGFVILRNAAYDIAVVQLPGNPPISSVNLSCETNYVGQKVIAHGNPRPLRNVSSPGSVAGPTTSGFLWKEIVPVSLAGAPGMSGGGVMDTFGNVVGIYVGAIGTNANLGVMVPGTVLCKLLERR
jgi:S1-C subfamily serine protease